MLGFKNAFHAHSFKWLVTVMKGKVTSKDRSLFQGHNNDDWCKWFQISALCDSEPAGALRKQPYERPACCQLDMSLASSTEFGDGSLQAYYPQCTLVMIMRPNRKREEKRRKKEPTKFPLCARARISLREQLSLQVFALIFEDTIAKPK